MSASIPAKLIADVIPNVLTAGGTALDLSGLYLTNNSRIPMGSVVEFVDPDGVAAYFGVSSEEYTEALIYFAGPANALMQPAQILFAQYPAAAVPAFVRGAPFGLTLAQINALATGTITITFNGVLKTSSTVDLSGATSFSNAAAIIQTALGQKDAVVTGSIAGTTMTVTAVTSGTLAVGQSISGSSVLANTVITALGSGAGGTGTYTVNNTQTVSSTTISAGPALVTYDSVTGAFVVTGGTPGASGTITFAAVNALATALGLTSAAGGVISQGAAAGVPATNMAAIIGQTQNFASFSTIFEPSTNDAVAFAAWNNGQQNRYAFILWDSDVQAYTANSTTSAMYLIIAASYGGTIGVYQPSQLHHASLVMSAIASLNFEARNGRKTLAFTHQEGLLPGVADSTTANNLQANGYNYYGQYATANDEFTFLYDGQISGAFLWIDSYVNQIWMNNNFQLALMNLFTTIGNIPFNQSGYSLLEQSLQDVINQALNFGAIQPGVTLSALQKATVNNAAGKVVDPVITQRGWYLAIQSPSPEVRAARGPVTAIFFYCDGQSVQKITLVSAEIQ